LKQSVSRQANEANLKFAAELLRGLEHAVFFGTLLGLVRDGRLIEGDDDVDIYVNGRERQELLARLASAGLAPDMTDAQNATPYFLQIRREIDGETVLLDFYLYEDDPERDFILDRWNFIGDARRKENFLKVPKELFFPLTRMRFDGCEISLPARAEEMVAFLYGPNWKIPLAKGSGYYVQVINNVPRVFTGRLAKLKRESYRLAGQLGFLSFG